MESTANPWGNADYAPTLKITSALCAVAAQFIARDLNDQTSLNFLDIAAGTGAMLSEVLKTCSPFHLSSGSFTVTDFSPGMIEKAKRFIGSLEEYMCTQIYFQVMDAQSLEFEANQFTHLSCMFGIMFFADRSKAFSEMFRVLRIGGMAVISSWHHTDLADFTLVFADYLRNGGRAAYELKPFVSVCSVAEEFKQELLSAGFSSAEIHMEEKIITFGTTETAGLFRFLSTNPVIQPLLGGAAVTQWEEFLRENEEVQRMKWVDAAGNISFRVVSNIAVARK